MNIEGTPHEKWLLVTFAYIIGFTTSLIMSNFAFTGSTPAPSVSVQPGAQMAAAPAAEVPSEAAQPDPESSAAGTAGGDGTLVYENQGLYFYGDDEFPTLLSKDIEAINGTYDDMPELADKQGFHTAVPGFEYFANMDAVYYCEQHDEDVCVPMYYDVSESVLHLVRDADGPVMLDSALANQVDLNDQTGLSIAGYASVNPSEPWVVAAD